MDFDVVIVGDFHVAGGTAVLAANEISLMHGAGLRVGLVAIQVSHVKADLPIRGPIRDLINLRKATLVAPDTRQVTAPLAIFENPRCFLARSTNRTRVRATQNVMAVHFPAFNAVGEATFDVGTVTRITSEIGARDLLWAPVSAVVRQSMAPLSHEVTISDWDWPYIVNAAQWKTDRTTSLSGKTPVLGRHSRPSREKWPDTRAEMFKIYPRAAKVQLLGFGHDALNLIGDRIPDAWQVFEFNEISPLQFLGSIDYFVYYHHSHYLEAFSVAILEAMAAGLLPILPKYLEKNYGDAALYPEPGDAFATVRSLHQDWGAYRKRATAGLDFVHERASPAGYLARIDELAGARPKLHAVGIPANPAPAPSEISRTTPRSFDVLVVADMTRTGDIELRIAGEISALAEAGYRVGLLHFPAKPVTRGVSTRIAACVRDGRASVVSPEESVRARLILAFGPHALLTGMEGFKTLSKAAAERIIVVADAVPNYDVEAKSAAISYLFDGHVTWAPTNGWVRTAIERRFPSVPLEAKNWLPVVQSTAAAPINKKRLPVVAGSLPAQLMKSADAQQWNLVPADNLSRPRFLDRCDAVVWYPDPGASEWPDAAIAQAIAGGKLVVLPRKFEPQFGLGATYSGGDRVHATVKRLWSNKVLRTGVARRAKQHASSFYSEQGYRDRLSDLIGKPSHRRDARSISKTRKPNTRPRILFLASNGTGLGHVARLLAIARRLDRDIDPIFATFGHAVDVISQFGYPAHYIPSPIYSDLKTEEWDAWLRLDLQRLIEAYDIKLIVFDGNSPSPGLVDAAHAFSDCKLAWVRRGMWNANSRSSFEQAALFDLIIEPGDLAASRDAGPTAKRRGEVLQVDPIMLLEKRELLSRKEAARRLHLDPRRPTALVQVGSGSNRDIVRLVDSVVVALQRHEQLQIMIAEWSISSNDLSLWQGTTRLKGFPMAQYRNAFDFAVSAAGYNTFHETICYALPTIFLANADPSMDDQVSRARYAQDAEAAFELSEDEVEDIGPFIDLLMNKAARASLVANCRKLKVRNGAAAAAAAIKELVG